MNATTGRVWAYFLGWPGMNAGQFLNQAKTDRRSSQSEWRVACVKICLGVVVVWGLVRTIPAEHELLAGWVGLVGLVFVLHFGLFHLLALFWQRTGVNAMPIMRAPVLASSLSEFWNRRWNIAFNHLVHSFVFRPLTRAVKPRVACLATFFVSGLIHDLVISVPAGGGYGMPTTYFMAQGCAVLLERSHVGRRMGLRGGWRGWIFTILVVAGPVFWLFHPPFIKNVILPMLTAIGATEGKI